MPNLPLSNEKPIDGKIMELKEKKRKGIIENVKKPVIPVLQENSKSQVSKSDYVKYRIFHEKL